MNVPRIFPRKSPIKLTVFVTIRNDHHRVVHQTDLFVAQNFPLLLLQLLLYVSGNDRILGLLDQYLLPATILLLLLLLLLLMRRRLQLDRRGLYVDNVAAQQCCQTGVDDFVADIAVVFDIVVIASIAIGGLLLLVCPVGYDVDRRDL